MVAVLKATIWMFILVLIENTLNLAQILSLGQREHHENSSVRRKHSLHGNHRKGIACGNRRCDLIPGRECTGDDDATPLQTIIIGSFGSTQACRYNDDGLGIG